MGDLQLSVETAPRAEDVRIVEEGLRAHALPVTLVAGFQPLAVFARDAAGRVVGGAVGRINWTWLDVSLLWVADERRGQRLGARLMREIETVGRACGCRQAHLDTFSYQARPFYEKLGYRVFAVLEDYPPGHQRFFLRKDLA
jgi:GNAT superfamily N-acetyltransferase